MPESSKDNATAYRLAFIRLVFFGFLIVIVWRLFQLQIVSYGWYSALASGQHDIFSELIPERGEIYVKDSLAVNRVFPAAVNKPMNFIFAVPREIKNVNEAVEKLKVFWGDDTEKLKAMLAKPDDPYEPLKHAVDDKQAQEVADLAIEGIHIVPEVVRFYPDGGILSQILGFVGYVGERKEGQYGIEQQWEKDLAGLQGELKSERNAAGGIISIGQRQLVPAQDGADLVLTLDKNIQYKACNSLQEAVKKHGAASGSVVIIDPKTGAIKAACNMPSFDSNNYAKTTNSALFSNPIVSEAYEPGSIFKPFTMAAALDAGKVKPTTTYVDTGEVAVSGHVIRNSDLKANGVQTMTNVLEKSLNTGVIFAMRQTGRQVFADYVKRFGFGQNTGVELPHEKPGNINSLKDPNDIYPVTASFGQGITATPLQLVTAYGALANGGRLMKPYITEEIRYANGKIEQTKTHSVRQVISPQSAAMVSAMLVNVVEKGHGKRAGVPGYYVAGKTGTAQVPLPGGQGYDPKKTIGSFVGFAPIDNPRFVMAVKISEPKDVVFAESSAAPLFGELAKFLLEYYQVPPER
ncbi:penicillin-binding protein 2 [Patescibacteria group bacterium]|nr:penicillin-binding protein 2 [Patescibacteria group bacterium]